MPKFNVPYVLEYSGSILIEAESKEDAMRKVEQIDSDQLIEESGNCDLDIIEDEVDEEKST